MPLFSKEKQTDWALSLQKLNDDLENFKIEKMNNDAKLTDKIMSLNLENQRLFDEKNKIILEQSFSRNNSYTDQILNLKDMPFSGGNILNGLAQIGVKQDLLDDNNTFGAYLIFLQYIQYFRNYLIFKSEDKKLLSQLYDLLEKIALFGTLYVRVLNDKIVIYTYSILEKNVFGEISKIKITSIYDSTKTETLDNCQQKGVFFHFNTSNFSFWVLGYAFCQNIYSQLQLINQNVNFLKNMLIINANDPAFISQIQTQINSRHQTIINLTPNQNEESVLSNKTEIVDANIGEDADRKIRIIWFNLQNYINYWENIFGIRAANPEQDGARNNEAEIIPQSFKNDKIQQNYYNLLDIAFEKLSQHLNFSWHFNEQNISPKIMEKPVTNSTQQEEGVKNESL